MQFYRLKVSPHCLTRARGDPRKEASLCNSLSHTIISTYSIWRKASPSTREALQLTEARRKEAPDGSFILVFLGDGRTPHLLELTWLKDRQEPYNLGDNEFHLAFTVDDFASAHAFHQKMGSHLLRKQGYGNLLYQRSGRLLDRDPTKKKMIRFSEPSAPIGGGPS